MEDLHRLDKKELRQVQALLMPVAEDGVIVAAKAASPTYECRTALHVNTNRQSILEAAKDMAGPQGRARDANMPMDLFSRLDLVVDVTGGESASVSTEDMTMRLDLDGNERQDPCLPDDDIRARKDREAHELKLLVARLKDRIPFVRLKPVEAQVRQLVRDLALVTREHTAKIIDEQDGNFAADSLLRRMANSVRKLLGASARLHNRDHATEADVECVWRMLGPKLEVVKWYAGESDRIRPQGTRRRQVDDAKRRKAERWAAILEHFGGLADVSSEELSNHLGFSTRSIQQELRDHGVRAVKGRYTIPTAEAYEEQVRTQGEPDLGKQAAILHEDPSGGGPIDEELDEQPEEWAEGEGDEESGEAVHVFEDSIQPAPPETAGLQAAFEGIVEDRYKDEAAKELLQLATQDGGSTGNAAYSANALMASLGVRSDRRAGLAGGVEGRMRTLLGDADWVTRGRLAISIYAESTLPRHPQFLKWELRENGDNIPKEVRRDLDAMLARMNFFSDRNYERAVAERKLREAAEQAEYLKQFEPQFEHLNE